MTDLDEGVESQISHRGGTSQFISDKIQANIFQGQILPLQCCIIFVQTMETKFFFQFEIIINVLASFFCFVKIPMLWVYDHYKYFNCFSAGTVFILQNPTSTDIRY